MAKAKTAFVATECGVGLRQNGKGVNGLSLQLRGIPILKFGLNLLENLCARLLLSQIHDYQGLLWRRQLVSKIYPISI